MNFRNPYFSEITKMNLLQQWILVHSVIYYTWDESLVSDKMFDHNARELVTMQREHRALALRTRYWYLFKDFDGTTGFDLPGRLTQTDRIKIHEQARLACSLGGIKIGKEARHGHTRRRHEGIPSHKADGDVNDCDW